MEFSQMDIAAAYLVLVVIAFVGFMAALGATSLYVGLGDRRKRKAKR